MHFIHFIKLHGTGPVDIPFSVAGDPLFQIDVLWTAASSPTSFIREALADGEADWMSQWLLDEADERRDALEQAFSEAFDEHEISAEEFERETEHLAMAPAWFLTLPDEQLVEVASLPLPERDHDPPLDHEFASWQRPTPAMFGDLDDPVNLQHVAAAWIAGWFE
jgi:hypothetical protein